VRSKLTPGFTSGKLKLVYPLIHDVCQDLLQHLKEDKGEGKEDDAVTVPNKIRIAGTLMLG
jgi:cytochrome P450